MKMFLKYVLNRRQLENLNSVYETFLRIDTNNDELLPLETVEDFLVASGHNPSKAVIAKEMERLKYKGGVTFEDFCRYVDESAEYRNLAPNRIQEASQFILKGKPLTEHELAQLITEYGGCTADEVGPC